MENTKIDIEYERLEAKLALVEGKGCDKYDYLIASFSGVMAGLIDVFLVGKPNLKNETNNSKLGSIVDDLTEKAVSKYAEALINKDNKTYDRIYQKLLDEGLSKKEFNRRLREELVKKGIPENFSREKGYSGFKGNNSILTYLENKYKVSYDQSNSSKIKENIDFPLSPDNHHIKSISHWPDLIGLIFAIADQFTGQTTFISNGEIIRVTPDQITLPQLRGKTFTEKIFFGFVNWFGHLLSDFCGSHSSMGRGDGIPIPFFGVFLGCDFGNFSITESDTQQGMTLADLAVKVYEEGYDARFGITMAIPVLIQGLMIRFIWALKARFYHKKPWNECIPSNTHKDLRAMLLIGNGALCLVDGTDVVIRSNGNICKLTIDAILHLNFIAWLTLAKNSIKEVCIRFNFTYEDLRVQFEYLDTQIEIYIQQLKRVDYEHHSCSVQELQLISILIKNEDLAGAIEKIDEYIYRHEIESAVINRTDFEKKLCEPNFTFRIGQ